MIAVPASYPNRVLAKALVPENEAPASVPPSVFCCASEVTPPPPPLPDISATVPSSFFVNNLPLSVLIATSPVTRSLALGSLPDPLLSRISLAIGFYLLIA